MVDDFFAVGYIIVSILVGVGSLAGFLYKVGEYFNKRGAESDAKKTEELKEYTNQKWQTNHDAIVDLGKRLDVIEDKMDKIANRADLVNGNVSNIRTDIADLQQDIVELYEHKTEEEEPSLNKKRLDLKRRIKRRQIEKDRIAQDERR